MENKVKTGGVYLWIPEQTFREAEFQEGDNLRFRSEKGIIVIDKVSQEEPVICTGECAQCPADGTDCDDNCDACPCRNRCEDYEPSESQVTDNG